MAALVVSGVVFSHWVLDLLVHRPDLPLYDDTLKIGLGLWDLPVLAFGLEILLLFGGLSLYFQTGTTRRAAIVTFALIMVAIQAYVFLGLRPYRTRPRPQPPLQRMCYSRESFVFLNGHGLQLPPNRLLNPFQRRSGCLLITDPQRGVSDRHVLGRVSCLLQTLTLHAT